MGFWIWHKKNIKVINDVASVYDCLAECADTDGCSSASVYHDKNSQNEISSRQCYLGDKRNGFMLYPKNNYISSNLYCQSKKLSLF